MASILQYKLIKLAPWHSYCILFITYPFLMPSFTPVSLDFEIKEGDEVRVEYPKNKNRSPHRRNGLYSLIKIDAFRDVYWVQDSKKITIVKRSYIKGIVPRAVTYARKAA